MSKYSFTSESKGLVLQDAVKPEEGSGIWAQFTDGRFETDDAAVAARLRKVDGITEGPAEDDVPIVPLVEVLPDEKATKTVWVEYATAHGMLEEDAKKATKEQLVQHFTVLRPATQDTPGQKILPEAQPRVTSLDPDAAATTVDPAEPAVGPAEQD